MAAHRRLDRRGDLPRAFRNQLASLREETEAAEAEFQGLEAQIKELERLFRSSLGESKANSRKQRSLKQLVHSVFGVRRMRSFLQPRLRNREEM